MKYYIYLRPQYVYKFCLSANINCHECMNISINLRNSLETIYYFQKNVQVVQLNIKPKHFTTYK